MQTINASYWDAEESTVFFGPQLFFGFDMGGEWFLPSPKISLQKAMLTPPNILNKLLKRCLEYFKSGLLNWKTSVKSK